MNVELHYTDDELIEALHELVRDNSALSPTEKITVRTAVQRIVSLLDELEYGQEDPRERDHLS